MKLTKVIYMCLVALVLSMSVKGEQSALEKFASFGSGIGGLATFGSFIYTVVKGDDEGKYQKEMLNNMKEMSASLHKIESTLSDMMETMHKDLIDVQKAVEGLNLDTAMNTINAWSMKYYTQQDNEDGLIELATTMTTGHETVLYWMNYLHNNVMGNSVSKSIIDIDGGINSYPLIRFRLQQGAQLYMSSCLLLINTKNGFDCSKASMQLSKMFDEEFKRVTNFESSINRFSMATAYENLETGDSALQHRFDGIIDPIYLSNTAMHNFTSNVGMYISTESSTFLKPIIEGKIHKRSDTSRAFGGFWENEIGDLGGSRCIDFNTGTVTDIQGDERCPGMTQWWLDLSAAKNNPTNNGVAMLQYSFNDRGYTKTLLGMSYYYASGTTLAVPKFGITFGSSLRSDPSVLYLGSSLNTMFSVSKSKPEIQVSLVDFSATSGPLSSSSLYLTAETDFPDCVAGPGQDIYDPTICPNESHPLLCGSGKDAVYVQSTNQWVCPEDEKKCCVNDGGDVYDPTICSNDIRPIPCCNGQEPNLINNQWICKSIQARRLRRSLASTLSSNLAIDQNLIHKLPKKLVSKKFIDSYEMKEMIWSINYVDATHVTINFYDDSLDSKFYLSINSKGKYELLKDTAVELKVIVSNIKQVPLSPTKMTPTFITLKSNQGSRKIVLRQL